MSESATHAAILREICRLRPSQFVLFAASFMISLLGVQSAKLLARQQTARIGRQARLAQTGRRRLWKCPVFFLQIS
jgi:hypothetical protein